MSIPSPKSTTQHRSSLSFRVLKEFDNHEMLIGFTNETVHLKGFIAIHSTKLGPALGGTRIRYYDSEEEAIRDVLNLSKAMSYKCALSRLPLGGGKGVIMANSDMDRAVALAEYARMVDNLRGLFKTGTDVGISDKDVVHMGKHTKHMLGLVAADRGDLSTSSAAALGVYYAIKAAVANVDGRTSLKGMRIAIKGVGKLGGELARLLYVDGAELLVSDIDQSKTIELQSTMPNIKVIDNQDISSQNVDVFAPCALGSEFTKANIDKLKCRIICGGANNQLHSNDVGDLLYAKGIVYVPDYIANAGGLIYVADELEEDGFNKNRVLKRTKAIYDTVTEVLSISGQKHISAHIVADDVGIMRINEGHL